MTSPLLFAFLLLLLGLIFIIAEVLIPSFGILSVLALCSFIGSVLFAFKAGPVPGIGFILACAVLAPMTVYFGFTRVLPNTFIGRQIIHSVVVSEHGESSGTDVELKELIGAEGTARSYLRPAGVADIQGQRIDVVSEGQLVPVGTRLKVVKVEGNRVVVRPVHGLASGEGEQA